MTVLYCGDNTADSAELHTGIQLIPGEYGFEEELKVGNTLSADATPARVQRHPRNRVAIASVKSAPLLEGTKVRIPAESRSPLRYPGSKRKMVPAIRQLIDANQPPPKLFIEPFCGGASVALSLLAQDAVERVMLADFNPLVAAFWHEAAKHGESLVDDMNKLKVTVDEWDRWRNAKPRSRRGKALKCLFLNRTTFSGILAGRAGPIGGRTQRSKYPIDCRFNKEALAKRILYIHRLAKEGRVVGVFDSGWQKTLDHARWYAADYAPAETVFYLDPPYVEKAHRLYESAFDERDHFELASCLRDTDHRWILSYDAEPLALNYYRGIGGIHEYRVTHHYTVTGARRRPVPGREVLFTNLPQAPTQNRK